jgi:hypothetical protein
MGYVRLIHWKAEEAKERAQRIQSAGYEVVSEPLNPARVRELRDDPPLAVVIDLSRLPSQGRDLALNIRKYKATRHVPLVFVDGDPEKVALIKDLLPDAVYTGWSRIASSLKRAIANPPADPVVPDSVMAPYKGTPLPKKLGIKTDSVVALVGAPDGFEETLGELPGGVSVRRQAPEPRDVTLWFVKSRKDLEQRIDSMSNFAQQGGLWIIWPKKASGIVSDLSQTVVREVGLGAGLVDFKVCSVDETWSGLRFTRREQKST